MGATTARTPGNGTGTLSYTLPIEGFDVESVYVSIDNTAGASAVTAELTIKDQSGVVIANKKQAATVAAGATGSATWALRLDDEGGTSTATGDLKYVTYPQTGAWFYADVTGSGGPDGWGWEVVDVNDNGTVFKGVPFLCGDVDQTSNGAWFYLRSSGFQLGITNNQHYRLTTGVGHIIDGFVNFAGPQLGFFGVTPVVRQATPVTLGDVIALLQAYGLAV